ncbi:MAG: hypothetical protein GVY11_00750 [Gammaproteobacteria bacterium]|jgi:membrane protein implicated in regulation of membrane protease activity|nr:hypothetical protein [Gammaproteobacteria bacterium]
MYLRLIALAALLVSAPAAAYIGPGSGISLLGGLWGVLVAIFLAIGAVLIWPIRYMFRRLRRKRGGAPATESAEPADAAEAERSSSQSE